MDYETAYKNFKPTIYERIQLCLAFRLIKNKSTIEQLEHSLRDFKTRSFTKDNLFEYYLIKNEILRLRRIETKFLERLEGEKND